MVEGITGLTEGSATSRSSHSTTAALYPSPPRHPCLHLTQGQAGHSQAKSTALQSPRAGALFHPLCDLNCIAWTP